MEGEGEGGKGGAGPSLLTVGARRPGVGGHCRLCVLAICWRSLLFVEVGGAGHCSRALGCHLWAPSHCMWAVGLVLGAGRCSWAVGSRLWRWDLFVCGARSWVGQGVARGRWVFICGRGGAMSCGHPVSKIRWDVVLTDDVNKSRSFPHRSLRRGTWNSPSACGVDVAGARLLGDVVL
jgi:hypothetical protein